VKASSSRSGRAECARVLSPFSAGPGTLHTSGPCSGIQSVEQWPPGLPLVYVRLWGRRRARGRLGGPEAPVGRYRRPSHHGQKEVHRQ